MLRVLGWVFGFVNLVVLVLVLLVFLAPRGSKRSSSDGYDMQVAAKAVAPSTWESKDEAGIDGFVMGNPAEAKGDLPAGSLERKIIYTASIRLVVEDFEGIPEQVSRLAKESGGFVADSELQGSSGKNRMGRWKIRVPIANFEAFVHAAKALGELQSLSTNSSDVSEEYYDVEARIRNKTKEEERLLKLLEERPGKLEDVIAIERELTRVREELERMQGRMRVLQDLTSLTTADITIQEIRNYRPEDAPTLATRVRRSFEESLERLKMTGANTLVAAAAIVPWLPLILVGMGICYVLFRRWRRRLG